MNLDKEPRWLKHFWLAVVDGGMGEDRSERDAIVSYMPVQSDDIRRFPELSERLGWYLRMYKDGERVIWSWRIAIPEED